MAESDPLKQLGPLLVEAIPPMIVARAIEQPICILRLYYFDTMVPSAYLRMQTVSEECRTDIFAERGRDAPFFLWASCEETGDSEIVLPPPRTTDKTHKRIAKLFEEVYALLTANEDKHMPRYRRIVQQVAVALNAMDWKPICPVSDDFVVLAADGSQHFDNDYDDIVNSIPAERLQLLRSRSFIGPDEEDWDHLPSVGPKAESFDSDEEENFEDDLD